MVALVASAPTLYRMFCEMTGYGGTVQRTVEAAPASVGRPISIRFDANVAPGLPWSFSAEASTMQTRLGEPVTAYYIAKNTSSEAVVARAVFNVAPAQTGRYFFKVECFCFTEQKLAPGEEARMPVVLWVDPALANDKELGSLHEITLSYTFFPQKGLSEAAVASTRDLRTGSQAQDEALKNQDRYVVEPVGSTRR